MTAHPFLVVCYRKKPVELKCRRGVHCSAWNEKKVPESVCGKSGASDRNYLYWLGSLHQEHLSAVVDRAQVKRTAMHASTSRW